MLERDVEVRQDAALGHQRQQRVDARVGIDVMQPHPDAEFGQRLAQFAQPGAQRPPADEAGAVLQVDAVGAGVLRDHQQLAHARFGERSRLLQHIADRPADQRTAQRRDDAEGATVVAALGDLEVGKMLRRQLDPLWWQQAGEWVVRLRQVRVHMLQHLVGGMRTGHRQHLRMRLANHIFARAETAGDDHLAVLVQRLADRLERLGSTAASMKPQVLTTTRSAPSYEGEIR
jgi:hypothetical protein